VKRITITGVTNPIGKTSEYEVKECRSQKIIGYVSLKYDDSPEKLVIKAMELVGLVTLKAALKQDKKE
jgi:hypothetical protein